MRVFDAYRIGFKAGVSTERPMLQEDSTQVSTHPPSSSKRKLRLNTVEASRKTVSRLIRAFDNGDLKEEKFKTLVYGLRILLDFFQAEKSLDFEKDLEFIKKFLENRK